MRCFYCKSCGVVHRAGYHPTNCKNMCCDGTVYEIDELFAELIVKLHGLGIVTTECCSGHAHDEKSIGAIYISFAVKGAKTEFIKNHVVVSLNKQAHEAYKFEVIEKEDEYESTIRLCVKPEFSDVYINDSPTCTILNHTKSFIAMLLYTPKIIKMLYSLTGEKEKLKYARYRCKLHA